MARPVSIRDEDILDAAREVFLAHGIRATSAMVAERARVSEGIIFRRFKTKEGLFRAALDVDLKTPPEVAELVERAGTGSVVENLHDTGVALASLLRVNIPLSMLALTNPDTQDSQQGHTRNRQTRESYFKLIEDYVREEVALGRLRAVAPDVFAFAYVGGIKDYVVGKIFRAPAPQQPSTPAFVRALLDLLLHGAHPQATTPPRR
ncbi:TetR/AcrR family transcriptional regulator [Myxococcus sp. K38C18041901]|uniref:TetR/AcrR family transcriptional regulator n=1 Tax=Myxococcus guangdongensis TaxID=2906760 RepID=UPI0020A7BB75|nr:TetR/AcrR family transcriptional regulator [Myxococcus guangdongensis]MCP3065585.1 TetR/AcrR family transcriptional regulator [Myxococcus guangdongensis]